MKIMLDEVRSKSMIQVTESEEEEILKLLKLEVKEGDGLVIRCERLLTDLSDNKVDFDTVGYFYADHLQKGMEKIQIYKYFKNDNGVWVTISPDEYRNRVVRHEKREYEKFWGNTKK